MPLFLLGTGGTMFFAHHCHTEQTTYYSIMTPMASCSGCDSAQEANTCCQGVASACTDNDCCNEFTSFEKINSWFERLPSLVLSFVFNKSFEILMHYLNDESSDDASPQKANAHPPPSPYGKQILLQQQQLKLSDPPLA